MGRYDQLGTWEAFRRTEKGEGGGWGKDEVGMKEKGGDCDVNEIFKGLSNW